MMSHGMGWIRQMQYADLNRVADIWLQTCIREYAFVCEHTRQTPEQFWGSRLERTIRAALGSDVYVFETEGQIAGFMTFIPATGGIQDLFVDLPFRNKGIGSDLIGVAKNLRGQVCVVVYQRKEAAVRFYERQGFHVNKVFPPSGETGQVKVTMEWKAEPCEPG